MSLDRKGTINIRNKSKVALKLLGGGVPNVAYQFGVCSALKEWGFEIPSGCLSAGEDRKYGPKTLNPIIGSSSGAFAALCQAMGYSFEDLTGKTGRIDPISQDVIKDRLEGGPLSLIKRLFTSRRKYTRLKNLVHSDPSVYEHIINTYYPIWKMDALEHYLRHEILNECSFETLRAELHILAVALEQRLTFIWGEESRPRDPEADYKFQSGIDPWEAAAGSMSLPPYYEPYELDHTPEEVAPYTDESVVLIDGETRDPFSTDVAEDSGADLVFVSSFYRVHEYTPELGHISEYGTVPIMFQERAQARDANKHNSIRERRFNQRGLELYREEIENQYEDPETIERKMKKMEEALGLREGVDVVEIQAQDYLGEELTYPYWDPFTLNQDVLDYQFQAGREVARQALEENLEDDR